MRQIIGKNYGSYSFNPLTQKITIGNTTDTLTIDNITLITNLKSNTIIYQPSTTGKSATVANNIITLEYNTTLMSATDTLEILVNIPATDIVESKIKILKWNIELIQGIDWSRTITVNVSNLTDPLNNARLIMKLRDAVTYTKGIDTLSILNGRIKKLSSSICKITFPGTVTSKYTLTSDTTIFPYSTELITSTLDQILFEGTVTVYRKK